MPLPRLGLTLARSGPGQDPWSPCPLAMSTKLTTVAGRSRGRAGSHHRWGDRDFDLIRLLDQAGAILAQQVAAAGDVPIPVAADIPDP